MRWLALLVVLALGVAGCGATDDVKDEVSKRVEEARAKIEAEFKKAEEQLREGAARLGEEADEVFARIEDEVNEALADIEGVVPQADEDTVPPQLSIADSFTGFMNSSFANVDRFWQRTLAAANLPRPRVRRVFVGSGQRVRTRCQGRPADDQAAFYCPADDTIYVGQSIARDIREGLGDFGVAYVIAHEYAHNVQQELGWYEEGFRFTTVAPFELQADCMAGAWAFAVYREGLLDEGDVEEAVQTAYAVGDFDFTNPQHHGTPNQRAKAWQRGYRTGDPSRCTSYLRT